MTSSYVQLPADGSGKALASEEVTQTGAPNSSKAHLQKLVICDKNGNVINRPYGPLRVSMEDKTLFYDPFESLDTTDRWTADGAKVPSISNSVLTFGVATTASAFGRITSKPTFNAIIPGFLQTSFALSLADAAAVGTGGHRFWGIGTSPATPAATAGNKITNGIGFEIDTDGKMYACVYAGGTRIFGTDLSATGTGDAQSKQPTTTIQTRYIIQIRTDRIYWFIEDLSTPVATATFQVPNSQVLPLLIQNVNPAASVAAGGYPIAVQGAVVADTAGNHTQLSDGAFPWRKATVSAAGRLAVDNSDVAHDGVNSTAVTQIGGHASPADVPPTAVSAAGDRVRGWFDRSGAQVVRRKRIRDSYSAVFRLAETAAALELGVITAANTTKQIATLHHAASSTKDVWLQRATLYVMGFTIATKAVFELRHITSAPATPAPAITPRAHHQGAAATECIAGAVPGTGGTDVAVNSPIAVQPMESGITGAAGTTHPPAPPTQIDLYNAGGEDDAEIPVVLRAGVLEGVAIVVRTVAANTTPGVRCYAVMRWTEETP